MERIVNRYQIPWFMITPVHKEIKFKGELKKNRVITYLSVTAIYLKIGRILID